MSAEAGRPVRPYLLLRATAARVPLKDNSVSLMIATPPGLGEKRARRQQFCTSDEAEYQRLMAQFLAEAERVVQPGGYLLFYPGHLQHGMSKVFQVHRKLFRRGRSRLVCKRPATFTACYGTVKGFCWDTIPVWVYRAVIRRYSAVGDIVAHVFSGSGNSAIAAVAESRKPVLIDLHYHREVQRRLDRRIRSQKMRPSARPASRWVKVGSV